jgi:hypothetical protein
MNRTASEKKVIMVDSGENASPSSGLVQVYLISKSSVVRVGECESLKERRKSMIYSATEIAWEVKVSCGNSILTGHSLHVYPLFSSRVDRGSDEYHTRRYKAYRSCHGRATIAAIASIMWRKSIL